MVSGGVSWSNHGTYLSLDEAGRDNLAPVTVEEGEGSGEGGGGDTPEHSLGNNTPPARLRFVDG